MSAHKAALDARSVEAVSRSGYPQSYRARVLPRSKRRLGDAFGLTRIGINYTTLPPGKESACGTGTRTRMSSFMCSRAKSCCAPARANSC
jgi:hypothetical protein